jgi:hypothetical protein
MAKQQDTNHIDKFAEALEVARNMQQDWLNYGLDFVNLHVEDSDGDWLERWAEEESVLDSIKGFLISHDDVAERVRQCLGERSLFDIAIHLEEFFRLPHPDDRLYAVKKLLAGDEINRDDDTELRNLADHLLQKMVEIL